MPNLGGTGIQSLGHDIWLIDLMEQGTPYRTCAYLLGSERPTLIDTGSGASHQTLVNALYALGLTPGDLSYIIVTHVHLDHAGGAGQLMAIAPNAKLVVHPRGARHMVDPSRLWNGARSVYGKELESLFGSIVPVESSRVMVQDHQSRLDIGGKTLTFYDAPGHARHHFAILDPDSESLFAGDALGIRYRSARTGWDFEWVMPSTSPVDFDPAALRTTVDQLRELPFSTVYHAHFGASTKREACEDLLPWADGMASWIHTVENPHASPTCLMEDLRAWTLQQLVGRGHRPGLSSDALTLDLYLNTMGLQVYYDRNNPPPSPNSNRSTTG